MYATISETLRQALRNAGVPAEKIGDFDQHSTIALELGEAGTILVSHENDRLWMWSEITQLDAANLDRHAPGMLALLQHPLPGVVTGQAVFGKRDEHYEIKLLIEDECATSPDKLYDTLDAFFDMLISVRHLLG